MIILFIDDNLENKDDIKENIENLNAYKKVVIASEAPDRLLESEAVTEAPVALQALSTSFPRHPSRMNKYHP